MAAASDSAVVREAELIKMAGMHVDTMAVLLMNGDFFNDRRSHLGHYCINERALRYGYVVRIQKYLGKFFVIRVA